MIPLTIRPPVAIGVYAGDPHLCSRETCRFTGSRHVCDLFRQQLTPTDFFDEDGNRLLRRCGQCREAQACTVPPGTRETFYIRQGFTDADTRTRALMAATLATLAKIRMAEATTKPHRNNLRSRRGK